MNLKKLASVLRYTNDKPILTTPLGVDVPSVMKSIFPGISPEKIARAAGAPGGSRAAITSEHPDILGVRFSVDNPVKGRFTPLLSGYRTFHRFKEPDGSQRVVLVHHNQYANGEALGKGFERFNEQLKHLRDIGVGKIHMETAAGSNAIKGANGFYTWPRFHFNGKLSPYHLKALPPEIQRALEGTPKDFHTLFSIPGGPEAWKDKGFDTEELSFDTDPNSPHSIGFNNYYNERKAREELKNK